MSDHQPGRYTGPLTKLSDPKPVPAPTDEHLLHQADLLGITVPQLKLLKQIKREALERPDGRQRRVLDGLTERGLAMNKGYARYVLSDAGRRALALPVPEAPHWLSRSGVTGNLGDATYYGLPDGTLSPEQVQDVDQLDPGHARRARVRHEDARPTKRRAA